VIASKVAKTKTKKIKKSSRFKTILVFALAPLIVWAVAFLVWLYWNDLAKSFTAGTNRSKPAAKSVGGLEKDAVPPRSDEPRSKERILDSDRQKLDDIIRKENR
jgi:hypothetical protein